MYLRTIWVRWVSLIEISGRFRKLLYRWLDEVGTWDVMSDVSPGLLLGMLDTSKLRISAFSMWLYQQIQSHWYIIAFCILIYSHAVLLCVLEIGKLQRQQPLTRIILTMTHQAKRISWTNKSRIFTGVRDASSRRLIFRRQTDCNLWRGPWTNLCKKRKIDLINPWIHCPSWWKYLFSPLV